MLLLIVFGPVYFCDNAALQYRSAQTRLFGVHKEQQATRTAIVRVRKAREIDKAPMAASMQDTLNAVSLSI